MTHTADDMHEDLVSGPEWHIPEGGGELLLIVGGKTYATITRWSDNTTGEHAWWTAERFSDQKSLALHERLCSVCDAGCRRNARLPDQPHGGVGRSADRRGEASNEAGKPANIDQCAVRQICGHDCRESAKWARDILDDTEASVRPEAVERFGMEIAGVLDRLSIAATRKPRT